MVLVEPDRAGLARDELVAALRFENVMARRYFHPGCHRMEPYRRLDPSAGERLPITERLAEQVMVLPMGQGVATADAELLTAVLRRLVGRAPEVRAALAASTDLRLPRFLRRPPVRAGRPPGPGKDGA